MQLTKHTDFAFRIMIYLSMMENELTTIKQICDTFDISKSHAMKIVNTLANKGWIDSVRGKKGGIRLGIDPKQIMLKEVIILMEKTLDPVNCSQPPCLISGICGLKDALLLAQQAYLSTLATISISDLKSQQIQQRLNSIPIIQEPIIK